MRSKKAFKNIITSLLFQFCTIICGFIVPKLIIDNFGSKVNGLITSITQFLAYITLLESGIGPVIKAKLYKPIAQKNKSEIQNILYASEKFFKVLSRIFLIYISLLCIIYPMIVASDFDTFFTVSLILIISISTFAEYYFGMTYKLFLQADQKGYVISIIQIITTVFNTIFVIILIKLGVEIQFVKLMTATIYVARPLFLKYYFNRKYDIKYFDVDKNYKLDKKWDGLAQHIASVIHTNTDVVVITIFLNVLEVSVYSVYMLVVNGVKRIAEALTGGIEATFGDMISKNEKETLRNRFDQYEFLYLNILTILFSCTLILITPFVSVYTSKIADVNYVLPLFGFLIVLAEFVHSIRMPYNLLTLSAGHFKETRTGAWVEAVLNIVLSVILVFHYGLVGVAIGTLVAMIIRTIEFVIHASKYILERSIFISMKKFMVLILETSVLLLLNYWLSPYIIINSYLSWFLFAILVFFMSCLFVFPVSLLIFKDQRSLIKKILMRKKK